MGVHDCVHAEDAGVIFTSECVGWGPEWYFSSTFLSNPSSLTTSSPALTTSSPYPHHLLPYPHHLLPLPSPPPPSTLTTSSPYSHHLLPLPSPPPPLLTPHPSLPPRYHHSKGQCPHQAGQWHTPHRGEGGGVLQQHLGHSV